MTIVTFLAPVNMAVIKYWGKKDEKLILPLNDSLSVAIDMAQMNTKTSVMISSSFEKDRIWLNGREEPFTGRFSICLEEIRKRAGNKSSWKVHVCSENNFPTAAGLASSAAGFACLVVSLAKAFGVTGELTGIARRGSGSACRSLFGGFVRWNKGEKEDGSDSVAVQVLPESHWPDLRILILVVSDEKKKVGSTHGAQITVKTSDLLKYRVSHVVPHRIKQITKAIEQHDFERFAELTMKDSNSFHSVCLDSFPPLVYMNQVSHKIVEFVHAYNKLTGSLKLAYTFDAGANATLFLEKENVPEVLSLIKQVFPPANGVNYVRGLEVTEKNLEKDLVLPSGPQEAGLLKYIIHTKVGEGPKELNDHLLDPSGLPINKTDS